MPGQPALELVNVGASACVKIWSHGLPYPTVRWHFHPEYEIHLITSTSGRSFVGDYIGRFEPGNLVLIGPNVPHNWLSDVPPDTAISERCLVLQFTEVFAASCIGLFPELRFLGKMLQFARRGLEFSIDTGAAAGPIMRRMLHATGAQRLELFFALLSLIQDAPAPRALAGVDYQVTPDVYLSQPLNHVLTQIAANPAADFRENDLAALSGYSPSTFSKAFKRKTGISFVRYLQAIRLNRACEMLMSNNMSVVDICFDVGFNNLSNFNRQFRSYKGMSPSELRRRHRRGAAAASTAPASRLFDQHDDEYEQLPLPNR